jgi:hypothetical protein
MRGKMLWFNEKKDLGFILTDEGERLSVLGPAFAGGGRPEGRCAQMEVEFQIDATGANGTEKEPANVHEAQARAGAAGEAGA